MLFWVVIPLNAKLSEREKGNSANFVCTYFMEKSLLKSKVVQNLFSQIFN